MTNQLLGDDCGTIPADGYSTVRAQLAHLPPPRRQIAINRLGEFGPVVADSIPFLEGYTEDPDLGIQRAAKRAITKIRDFEPTDLQSDTAADND